MANASSSVLKLVSTIHRIGRKIKKPDSQAAAVETQTRLAVTLRAIAYASRFRPMIRTTEKATILAITTATKPPAEGVPTSNLSSARAEVRQASLVVLRPR